MSSSKKRMRLDVEAMIDRIVQRVRTIQEGERAAQALFADDEIVLECRQSLKCPITFRRPQLPAKGCLFVRMLLRRFLLIVTKGMPRISSKASLIFPSDNTPT